MKQDQIERQMIDNRLKIDRQINDCIWDLHKHQINGLWHAKLRKDKIRQTWSSIQGGPRKQLMIQTTHMETGKRNKKKKTHIKLKQQHLSVSQLGRPKVVKISLITIHNPRRTFIHMISPLLTAKATKRVSSYCCVRIRHMAPTNFFANTNSSSTPILCHSTLLYLVLLKPQFRCAGFQYFEVHCYLHKHYNNNHH